MSKNQMLDNMELLFLALADKTRLRLLNLLRDSEVSVTLLMEILHESQPKISRHLAYLRNAGIVEPRREGKQIFYSLIIPNDKSAAVILDDLLNWLNIQPQLQIEYNELSKRFVNKNLDKSNLKENANNSKSNIYAHPNALQNKEELEIYLL